MFPDAPEKAVFWNAPNQFYDTVGQRHYGTNATLFRDHPAVRSAIWDEFYNWLGSNPSIQPPSSPAAPNPNPLYQPIEFRGDITIRPTASGTPAPVARDDSPVQIPTTTRKKAFKTEEPLNPVAPYVPDPSLNCAAAARSYLAYPKDTESIEIEGHDWEDVKDNHAQTYIGLIYDALTHPYAKDIPQGVTLSENTKQRYHEQQAEFETKIQKLLQNPSQIKAAKARRYLVFDAALSIHEVGISKEVLDIYRDHTKKGSQPPRNCRVDITMKCSTRIHNIVKVVSSNKLVGFDLLMGKNHDRLAQNPDVYLADKFGYLRSNKTRQEKADKFNAELEDVQAEKDVMTGMKGKQKVRGGKKRKSVEVESEEEDEGADFEVEMEEEDENLDNDEEYVPKKKKRARN